MQTIFVLAYNPSNQVNNDGVILTQEKFELNLSEGDASTLAMKIN